MIVIYQERHLRNNSILQPLMTLVLEPAITLVAVIDA